MLLNWAMLISMSKGIKSKRCSGSS